MTNTISLPSIGDGEDKTSPLKNRIRKNYRHLKKWAKKTSTNAFRVYDRDIKEYPVSIDFYDNRFAVYFFSSKEDEEPKEELFFLVNEAITSIFQVSQEAIFWKTRMKRKKTEQYEKLAEEKSFFTVYEYGTLFKVNLNDYLDTGLFLDHRETRQMVANLAQGKRVLNLFSYTASFSLQAAVKGALFTKSVDLSNTYTNWAQENFLLNGISLKNHLFIREDCLKFLDEALFKKEIYDIIVIDPPTLSRSKKMDQMFDIQEEYVPLIKKSLYLLAKEGVLFFSTNSRKFFFDRKPFPSCKIEEITEKTIPEEFHNKKIHKCWKITF
jgi:23S rRNA (cytosine1962-C5)-methyltransferase